MKLDNIESGFVTGPSNILLAGVYVGTFQPGNLQAGAVKGLISTCGLQQICVGIILNATVCMV